MGNRPETATPGVTAPTPACKQTEQDRRFCHRIERAVLRRAEGYQIPLQKT